MSTSSEKPSWVTNVENTRAEMGKNTVSSATSGNTASSGGSYTPAGKGSDYYSELVNMSDSDKAALKAAGDAWNAANAAGNQDAMDKAHADAEAIRAQYGYLGGDDGSEYISNKVIAPVVSGSGGVYDLSEYLKQSSAAQIEAALANLKAAYEKSMAGYDASLELLPQTYDKARNNTAAQDALARKSFDERAVASGLSSGASGQVELARSSAYQRDIANIDQEQANATSEIDLAKANLTTQYENAIVEAQAKGNAELAEALYQEMIRVQNLEREDAQIAAAQDAAAQELALKYGLELNGGTTTTPSSSIDTGTTPKKITDTPTGKGYDNGSLTAQQVKQLQAAYGLAQDGMWGPNSQSTTGMSADEAWANYIREKYSNLTVDTSQRDNSAYWSTVGNTQSSPARTNLSYDASKDTFTWNGVSYGNVSMMLDAMSKANLTDQEKAALTQEFDKLGFGITFN